jgi:16S rRNA (guanine966-N2)-methyltransferase
MLKIVGGKHRGRALMAPEGGATRPTASRAREHPGACEVA